MPDPMQKCYPIKSQGKFKDLKLLVIIVHYAYCCGDWLSSQFNTSLQVTRVLRLHGLTEATARPW